MINVPGTIQTTFRMGPPLADGVTKGKPVNLSVTDIG
jgi:hypothetical protein